MVLTRLELVTDNAVRTALRVLEDQELVVCRGGRWCVADPFMAHWLRAGDA